MVSQCETQYIFAIITIIIIGRLGVIGIDGRQSFLVIHTLQKVTVADVDANEEERSIAAASSSGVANSRKEENGRTDRPGAAAAKKQQQCRVAAKSTTHHQQQQQVLSQVKRYY